MAKRGRKPKPTARKVLEGTWRADRANPNEPTPEVEIPPRPAFLKGDARKAWNELAPMLKAEGILTGLDSMALSALCQVYARWRKAERAIERRLVMKAPSGHSRQLPQVQVAAKALDQLRALLAEFGLTPSSRTRISARPKDEKDDASIESFMGKKPRT